MKKTKVKININVRENLKNKVNELKGNCFKVVDKIKANLKENKGKNFTKQSVKYYTLLILMIGIAIASTYANIKEYQKVNAESYVKHSIEENEVKANSSNVIAEEKDEKLETTNDEDKKEANIVVPQTYQTAISSISTNVENVGSNKEILPVSGKVVQEYSQDNVVYYDSLGLWKTHPGVDISCEKGEQVVAVMDGKVVGIYQDEVFGYSVVVESEEYICVYSSLDTNILVSIGNKLTKGQHIGYVGTNAAEETQGVHLHFELMQDGEYINPSVIGIK